RNLLSTSGSADPATAEHFVSPIENGSLTRRYGALRRKKSDLHRRRAHRLDASGCWFVPITYLHARLYRLIQTGPGNPIDIVSLASVAPQLLFLANRDTTRIGIDLQNVERPGRGDSQAAALPHREMLNPGMGADNLARCGDKFPRPVVFLGCCSWLARSSVLAFFPSAGFLFFL